MTVLSVAERKILISDAGCLHYFKTVTITNNWSDKRPVFHQDDLVTSGSLYADQAEQIKREQMELEEKMSRDLAQQRAQQTALIKEKLAQRKREQMKKLREQQEMEKAKVNLWISPCVTQISRTAAACVTYLVTQLLI